MHIQETNMKYFKFGNGPKTMVMLPGASLFQVTGNKETVEEAYKAFTKEYTIYLLDVRDDVDESYTLIQMSEDVYKAIQLLGLKEIYLFGASMGGMQAIYIAGTYPTLVKKLILAASSAKGNDTSDFVFKRWISCLKNHEYKKLLEVMANDIYSKNTLDTYYDVLTSGEEAITKEVASRFIHITNTMLSLDFVDQAQLIKCPTLILGCKGDHVLTGESSILLSKLIKNSECYMYDETYGHGVFDEAPDFKMRMLTFFDK